MSVDVLSSIKDSLANLDMDKTIDFVKKAVELGFKPMDIVNAMADGMRVVGVRYERGEYFVSDLIVASEIFKEVMNILKSLIMKEKLRSVGKVVVGTVEGDIYDIGKNLVATILRTNGFEVIDLGVDVSPENLLKEIGADAYEENAVVAVDICKN